MQAAYSLTENEKDEVFIRRRLHPLALNEPCLNYLTRNPSVSESSKPHAGYPDHPLFTSELTAAPARRKVGQGVLTVRENQPGCRTLPPVESPISGPSLLKLWFELLIVSWDSARYHIKPKYSIAGSLSPPRIEGGAL